MSTPTDRPIIFFSPEGTLGGAERVLLDILAELRTQRPDWPLQLIALNDGPLLREAAELGVTSAAWPLPGVLGGFGDTQLRGRGKLGQMVSLLSHGARGSIAGWRYLRRLKRFLREQNPRLLYGNGIKAQVVAALARPAKTPVLWHVHDFIGERPTVGRVLRRLVGRVERVIANSHAVAADVQSVLPSADVTPIHNAVDLRAYSPDGDAADLDALANLPPADAGTVRVGHLATYARWKGQDIFLRAAARVMQQTNLPLRFYIVGGPIYKTAGSQFDVDELRRMAEELDIDEHVGFVPFQSDTAAVYRGLDVFTHASTRPEPFGRTIIEAMACRRAVIVTDAGGASELFRDEETAIGVPPGDATALAEAIRQLVTDQALRTRLGAAARQDVEARFARERFGREIAEACEGAMGSSKN